ncbi:MerR family transcriptional regulator [Aestuariivirga sp.]|uniref:helix-turn-helix domain-containing protein n=1 Tax=Aestuariivirga sp. TaxID=2650926 RepID=UPI0039E3BE4B
MDSGTGMKTSGLGADGFLFIGELSRETGIDPKTIRFYERAELLSPPRHGKFRTYLDSDVRRLRNVIALRRMGVPIAQIRELFTLVPPDGEIFRNGNVAGVLRSHLDILKSRQTEIDQQIAQTAQVLQNLAA